MCRSQVSHKSRLVKSVQESGQEKFYSTSNINKNCYSCILSLLLLLPHPREVMFHLCLFVFQQGYTKCSEPVCTKFAGGMGHELREHALNVGADLVRGDLQIPFLLLLLLLSLSLMCRIVWLDKVMCSVLFKS